MTGAVPIPLRARLLGWLISPRLAVVCLGLLMVLTFWGTVYQVDHGLFAAQERFYNSWVLWWGGFLPFPGTQLVLAVLTANLLAYLGSLLVQPRVSPGILVIHVGLLTMLLGGGVTHYFAEEAQLTLEEGETSSVAASYHEWELAVWRQDGGVREVLAATSDAFAPGQAVRFEQLGLTVAVEAYYRNARAFQSGAPQQPPALSRFGLSSLQGTREAREPAENIAGGIFEIRPDGGDPTRVILFGEDVAPRSFALAGGEYQVALRRKRTPLPFVVTLRDFKRELHPGTEMARAFSSDIEVNSDGVDRALTISMNKPFRERGYTLYQASYREDEGRQWSTFAVTRNYGRLIPYVSTAVIVLGMIWHFVVLLVRRVRARA